MTVHLVVLYDIADDGRREAVSRVLEGLGPRVQLSVFEVDRPSIKEWRRVRSVLRGLIDPVEDQVRIYRQVPEHRSAEIIGARVVEERQDFWIVR